jgi:recombination protein RecT
VLPFKGKGQLIIGYKGYATLAQRTSAISDITARIIREKDYYDYEFGLEERLVHRPTLTEERGEPVAFYSVVRTNTGGKYWELMSVPEMEAHRDRFAMGRKYGTIGKSGPLFNGRYLGEVQGPWVDDFNSMAKKTVVIRALNLAPASTELQRAFDVDGSTRFDLNPQANVSEVSVVEDTGQDAVDGEVDPPDPAEPSADEWARMNAGEGTAP